MGDDELFQDVEDADMAEFPDAVKEAVSEAKVMIISLSERPTRPGIYLKII